MSEHVKPRQASIAAVAMTHGRVIVSIAEDDLILSNPDDATEFRVKIPDLMEALEALAPESFHP